VGSLHARTNRIEYWAESSEAYFAVNDFYPFVLAELRERAEGKEPCDLPPGTAAGKGRHPEALSYQRNTIPGPREHFFAVSHWQAKSNPNARAEMRARPSARAFSSGLPQVIM